jgi:hypothetical protein
MDNVHHHMADVVHVPIEFQQRIQDTASIHGERIYKSACCSNVKLLHTIREAGREPLYRTGAAFTIVM